MNRAARAKRGRVATDVLQNIQRHAVDMLQTIQRHLARRNERFRIEIDDEFHKRVGGEKVLDRAWKEVGIEVQVHS